MKTVAKLSTLPLILKYEEAKLKMTKCEQKNAIVSILYKKRFNVNCESVQLPPILFYSKETSWSAIGKRIIDDKIFHFFSKYSIEEILIYDFVITQHKRLPGIFNIILYKSKLVLNKKGIISWKIPNKITSNTL